MGGLSADLNLIRCPREEKEMRIMKMGIIGAGGIAEIMAATIQRLDSVEAYAIGARDLGRAEAFAERFGFTKAYGSYEELAKDDEIDLVYIAVPHSHHYKTVKLCLEYNKNVLCEKAFTVNAAQAEELFRIAEEKNLLLTEAIWTRYMPSRKMINDLVESGVIGEVTSMMANLGYNIGTKRRMWDPALAGGALLDLGVYLIHLARMVFGEKVKEVTASALRLDTGVDSADGITMVFEDGKIAVMHCNMFAALDRKCTIFGKKGYIEIQNVNNPEKISVYNDAYELVKEYPVPEQITGYEYEVLACKKAIAENRNECPEITHKETIAVMKTMDEIRKGWGYEIPCL